MDPKDFQKIDFFEGKSNNRKIVVRDPMVLEQVIYIVLSLDLVFLEKNRVTGFVTRSFYI